MKRFAIIMIFGAAIAQSALALVPRPGEDLNGAIEYLLDYVARSECVFIRNGKEHDAKAAGQHMEKKYKHYKDEIKTPEDFIRLAATKSTMSGKPYKVRLKTGEEMLCSEWLSNALEEHRKSTDESKDKKTSN